MTDRAGPSLASFRPSSPDEWGPVRFCSPSKRCWARKRSTFVVAVLLLGAACHEDEPPCLGARVATGIDHSCVLKPDGSLRCWGSFGPQATRTPGLRPPWGTGLTDFLSRGIVGCARRAGGGVACGIDMPREVPALAGDIAALAMGVSLSRMSRPILCAAGTNGSVRCGDLAAPEAFAPGEVAGVANVNLLAAGETLACGRASDLSLWCWGHGFLGDGMPARTTSGAVQVAALGNDVAAVSLGLRTACVVTGDGGVLCWGPNDSGEAGREGRPVLSPTRVEGLPAVQAISLGAEHACAVTRSSELWCWGRNRESQLGASIDGVLSSAKPVLVPLGMQVAEVSCGVGHTCVRDIQGAIWCWGNNELGQVGAGRDDLIVRAPTRVAACP